MLENMQFLQAVVVMGFFFLATTPRSLSVKQCRRDSNLGKMQRIQAIKQDILLRLGLDEEPKNPSNASDTPDEFLKEYKAVQVAQELNREHRPCAILDFNKQEVKALSPTEVKKFKPNLHTAVGDDCISNNVSEFYSVYRVKFQVNMSDDEFITSAQLRLRKSFLQVMDSLQETVERAPKDRVDIRLVTRPPNYYGEERHVYITMQFLAKDDINGLAIFNVTEAVILWLESSSSMSNMGELELDIRLRCPQPLTHSNTFIPNFQFFDNSDNGGLLVLTTYKDKNGISNTRKKRQASDNSLSFCNENQVECCLKSFRINFKRDMNWTWISEPKEIEFNYCKGECPIRWLSNDHARFLDILRSRTRNPTAAPEPCCVPNSYEDISLVMHTGGMFSMQNLDDVKVTSCSCR